MSTSNPPTKFAIVVAILCVAVSIVVNLVMPTFQEIFDDLGTSLPLATQFILYTYRWIWLGAVLSGIVWVCVHQHMLSEFWARGILFGIAICVVVYAPLGFAALYLPMFEVMDAIGSI